MRKTGLPRLFLLIIMAVMILGCGIVLTDPPTPTPVPMASPMITPIPPTITPIPPTETPIPTDTPAPTPTPASTQSISTIVEALRAAAEGRRVSDAAPYDPKKSGVHPIIIFSASKEIVDEWNAELPDAWRGQSVSLTELVAVVVNHEIVVERARYTAKGMGIFFLNQIRTDTEVILREAQTGITVAAATFPGGDPPTLKSGYDQIITAVYGTLVPYETVALWLQSFVEK